MDHGRTELWFGTSSLGVKINKLRDRHVGGGKWGTKIWIWGPPTPLGNVVCFRETCRRLLGEVRRTWSEPSGVGTRLVSSERTNWSVDGKETGERDLPRTKRCSNRCSPNPARGLAPAVAGGSRPLASEASVLFALGSIVHFSLRSTLMSDVWRV